MNNEKNLLVEYGLRENEADVYIACLRLGASTVYKISEKVRMPKSTVYDILKSLSERGFTTYVIKSGVKYFEAVNPDKLVDILEEKKIRIKEIIPKLKEMQRTAIKKPTIEVYQGREGLKTILQDILKVRKDFLIIGNFGKFEEYFKYYASIFVKKRIEEGITCKLIEEKSKENIELKRNDKKEKRITKFLDGMQELKSECYIYGDNIALLTLLEEEPIGIVIENKEISKLMRLLFNKLWMISS